MLLFFFTNTKMWEDQKQQTEEDIWKQEDQGLDIFLNGRYW